MTSAPALSDLNRFDGHDMCADQPFANAGVVTEPDDSFHPTAAGYQRMAEGPEQPVDNLGNPEPEPRGSAAKLAICRRTADGTSPQDLHAASPGGPRPQPAGT